MKLPRLQYFDFKIGFLKFVRKYTSTHNTNVSEVFGLS